MLRRVTHWLGISEFLLGILQIPAAKVTHWLTGNLANREIFKNFYEYKIIKKPIKGNDLTFVASIIPNKEKQLSQYLQ